MKAIGLMEFGGPEVLQVVELPDPEPGPGEVRIRVHAVAVNPTDLSFRSGRNAARLTEWRPPYIPGAEAAGVVDALGVGASGRLSVGDSVVAYVIPYGPRGGSYAELIVVPEASVVSAPQGFSFAEAATFIVNSATARLAVDALGLSPGTTVAVVGGVGAVGGFAIQLATHEGLMVIADAKPEDVLLVRSFGADIVVPRSADVAAAIRNEFSGGVPGLIDTAVLDAAVLPCITDGGDLVTLRGWSGPTERNILVHPVSLADAATDTALFERLRTLVEERVLTVRVATVLPADRAVDAHRQMTTGGVRGKIVLDFS